VKNKRVRRVLLAAAAGACLAFAIASPAEQSYWLPQAIEIPFELASRHIFVPVSVNGSPPLSFIFDTGNTDAIVDAARARELHLRPGRELSVSGAGSGSLRAFFVSDARFMLPSLPGFSQPIAIAVPLDRLPPRLGHDVDGILGTRFIEAFVVEVDYRRLRLVLHDSRRFVYDGRGTSLPLRFDGNDHPTVNAAVVYEGRRYEGPFVLDLGAASAVMLHSPFVEAHGVPPQSMPLLGSGGAAGETHGVAGHVSELGLGPYVIPNPPAAFSQDTSGAFARADVLGTIGERAMERFTVYLDYRRSRVILEPAADVGTPFRVATCGCSLTAGGVGFHVFHVEAVADGWPAAVAGIRPGDTIVSVDGRGADTMTLTELLTSFETPAPRRLRILRGAAGVEVTTTPRLIP
jgi:hypothetical protein